MTPAAGSRRPAAAPSPRTPRSWTRPSTRIRCTRCGPRWRRTPRRPGWPRAGPRTWSSPCTNWPPTPCATAPATAGSGSGNPARPCSARSATTACRSRPAPRQHQPARTDAAPWRAEPGHGLSLVRQVADQASLRSGPDGTLATISFALGAPGPPFRLDQQNLDGCTVLAVTGPLDLRSAAQLTDAIGGLLGQSPGLRADPGPVRPGGVGLIRPGRPDHRAAADRRQPARPDGPGRAPGSPGQAPARGWPGRPLHPGRTAATAVAILAPPA